MPVPYWEIISICWLVFAIYWAIRGIRRHRSKHKATLFFTVFNNGLLYLGFLLVLLGRTAPSSLHLLFLPQAIFLHIIGTIFVVVGIGFAIWSRQLLRNNWSRDVVIVEDQQLIHSGPYSIVRHPIYTGILLALFGTTLVASTIGSALGFVLALLSLWQKARMEEQLLSTEFGQQYANYQREVRFLIPFIY